jgi:hypothetical protein
MTSRSKWVAIAITVDSIYQHLLLTAEKKFWRCVESGKPPRLFGVEPPRPRIAAVRVVDMSTSNAWAEFAGVFCRIRPAFLEHVTRRHGGTGSISTPSRSRSRVLANNWQSTYRDGAFRSPPLQVATDVRIEPPPRRSICVR